MEILVTIFTVWLLAALLVTPFSSKWGIAIFLSYTLLVPVLKINLGGYVITERLFYLFIVILLVLKYRERIFKIGGREFAPFAFVLLAQGMLIPFQNGVQFEFAFNALVSDLLSQFIFPLLVYTVAVLDNNAWQIFKRVLLICGVIFVGYGIYLLTIPGINPYLIATLPLYGQDFNEAYALGYSGIATTYSGDIADGRLYGRISSVFSHPMTYALNLGLFSIFLTYYLRKKVLWCCLLLMVIVIAIFTCGVRSAITAIGLTLLLVLISIKNKKYSILIVTIGVFILTLVCSLYPSMQEYLLSIFSFTDDTVSGSSVEMRIHQFKGCFDIILDCPYAGKGYNWTSYYVSEQGPHPELLCFESLVYMVLCNTGLIGVLIWLFFGGWMIYSIRMVNTRSLRIALMALFSYFIIFSIITGNYDYTKFFAMFYAILLPYNKYSDLNILRNDLRNKAYKQ